VGDDPKVMRGLKTSHHVSGITFGSHLYLRRPAQGFPGLPVRLELLPFPFIVPHQREAIWRLSPAGLNEGNQGEEGAPLYPFREERSAECN